MGTVVATVRREKAEEERAALAKAAAAGRDVKGGAE
jgi:hypothetical protein